jgi:poly(hydroxyalkanoate) depolymerase family esterase
MGRMARRSRGSSAWTKAFERSFVAITRQSLRIGTRVAGQTVKAAAEKRKPPAGPGDWISGLAMGPHGMRRYRLYRPPAVKFGERLPLMVMLHGCGQDAKSFAQATRINAVAARERFLVLYPEQDRLANAQGCWNWFDTRSGRAHGEADLIMRAIDQVCLLYTADPNRVAVAGLSAGASMAALLATRHPGRFRAVMMHSGVPPGTAHSTLSAVRAMHGGRPTRPLQAASAAGAILLPPLMVIHGSGDRVVAADNGQAAVHAWSAAAGATAAKGRTMQRGKRYPMQVTDYKLGSNTVATLVEVQQLGHAWSGGAGNEPYSDGQGPDASRMLWTFAARQFGR